MNIFRSRSECFFFRALVLAASLLRPSAGQSDVGDRRLIHRRPLAAAAAASSSPCGDDFRAANDPRSFIGVLGGAAVGGVLGGAAGYHLGSNKKPVVINNNVYNQLPSPCYNIPVQVSAVPSGGGHPGNGGGGGGYPGIGGGGLLGGNGIVGGILSNHPILSNILSGGGSSGGGLLGNGLGQNFASNREYRQFNRQIVRPLSRLFK